MQLQGFIQVTLGNDDPMLVPVHLIGLVFPKKKGAGCVIGISPEEKYDVKEDFDTIKKLIHESR